MVCITDSLVLCCAGNSLWASASRDPLGIGKFCHGLSVRIRFYDDSNNPLLMKEKYKKTGCRFTGSLFALILYDLFWPDQFAHVNGNLFR
jgi:hypothetical protein